MAEYRFYYFKFRSTLFDLKTYNFDDDANAVANAISKLKDEIHIEIWERDRKVGVVPENHPASD